MFSSNLPNGTLITSGEPFEVAIVPTICETAAPTTSICTQRVLHVINGEHFSGAERVQDLLALNLPPLGFDVTFACVKPERFEAARRSTVSVWDAAMQGRYDLRPAFRLAHQIREQEFALVHAHTPRSAVIGAVAASRAGVPFVYHVHSPTARDSTRWLQNWFNALSEKWTIRRASRLICVSPSLRNLMIDAGFDANRVSYVPNGVPGVPFDTNRSAPRDTWTLGMVALFRPRKGIEVLLHALAARRAAGDALRLRCVGPFETEEYEREVKALVEKLGLETAIDWTGFTTDVQAELKSIDLFILPSLFGEGLPMVVLESMAAGVPVIATRVEGIPIAIRDGVDGILIEPNDATALAEGIAKFTRGEIDWQQMREQAYAHHAAQFSDRAMAEGIAKVYAEVLE